MKRILVAEDEDAIREFVIINLKRGGYEVLEARDGAEALDLYYKSGKDIDVALLDVMMPNVDGITVCKQLREDNPNIGIIILTAKSQEMDKITGLMNGADDYVTKPFSPTELVARVDAIHRRVTLNSLKSNSDDNVTKFGDYTLNIQSRTFKKRGIIVDLTQVEYQIIQLFFSKPNTALSRDEILKYVWGNDYDGDDKIVDVNMRRLRMKVEDDPSNPKHLTTIWGFGYKWVE